MAKYNLKVLGVGGGGSNTVDFLIQNKVESIQTYAINTDDQALKNSKADVKIRLGEKTTKGLGAGALPKVGRLAAEEAKESLIKELMGADVVFIAAGMGGGTGTGAAPYIAALSKELGILTIGIVTKPFSFEGSSRMHMALEGLKELEANTDVTIVIPNEKLVAQHRDKVIEDAFILPDEVLQTAIVTIVQVLETVSPYSANVDLNTLRTTLIDKGIAVMGIGHSNNEECLPAENTTMALDNAIGSEILEISIHGAREFIILFRANPETIIFSELGLIESHLTNQLGYPIRCTLIVKNEENFSDVERGITLIAVDYEDKKFVEQITNSNEVLSDNIFLGL